MNFGNWGSNIQFATPLGATAWAVLLGIPVGIIALYFLKLRRRPVQVPSTLLWRRSLEDLHVNSLFQRLRKNLLLFLQLLAVLLAMLALLGPRIKGTGAQGQRFVLAIDVSASMSATDVKPSRLERAKEDAKKVIASMDSDDLAMVITFADRAKVVSNYTGDRRLLAQRIDAIRPTETTTSLREALQVAAGLANPSKQIGEGVVATQLVPPKLKIYTDGGFTDVEGFSLGNLEPEVIVIGTPPPPVTGDADARAAASAQSKAPSDNVAILALQSRRNDDRPDTYQVFGRVHNYRGEQVATQAQLLRHDPSKPGAAGTLIDAIEMKLAPQSEQAFKFDLPDTGLAELEVRLTTTDSLALDNRAFTVVGNPRKAQVLAVTSGNRYLVDTLRTPTAVERADVNIIAPEEIKIDTIARDIRSGRYDLIIYDNYRPETVPEANALYFGVLPPGPAYEKAKPVQSPLILDWDVSHPLLQYIRDLSRLQIAKAQTIELPPGATPLIESDKGPIGFIAPREGFSDTVITFTLMNGQEFNTDWFRYISFPLFLFNSLEVLGNSRESSGDEIHLPGQSVVLRAESPDGKIKVTSADGKRTETLSKTPQGTYVDNQVEETGIYHARWAKDGLLAFAVNQFDDRESDLATRGLVPDGVAPGSTAAEAYKIKIGYNPVESTRNPRPIRKDWWKPLALLALGVVLLEWYIYNRRVYI